MHDLPILLRSLFRNISLIQIFLISLGFLALSLLQAVIMNLIFSSTKLSEVNNYILFLVSGLLPWNFFSITLLMTTTFYGVNYITNKKVKVSKEELHIIQIFSYFLSALVAYIPLLFLLLVDKFFEHYSFNQLLNYSLQISVVIFLYIWLLVLTTGCSILLSIYVVTKKKDVYLVFLLLFLLFFLTPIVYSLGFINKSISGWFYLNPLTAILELIHRFLFNLPLYKSEIMVVSVTVTVFIVLLACLLYKKRPPFFNK
jgi:lipopolysaccharide transport system permease protein